MPNLADVAHLLRQLAYGGSLSADDAYEAMRTINSDDVITDPNNSDGLYFLALTFGLMAKGPTAEELHGIVRSISDQSVRLTAEIDYGRLLDISGTGGDTIKTLNVGTTASVVLASGGAYVAKQATRGYTGFTGSADIYQSFGADPFRADGNSVVRCLEQVGLVAFYTPAMSSGFKNRIDFLTKLRTVGLTYPTPWHLVSWVYSPFQMQARVYGVFDSKYLETLGLLFSRLNYRRVLVVHGMDGLDEVSNIGETAITELRDGDLLPTYTITPESLGIKRSTAEEIQSLPNADLELYSTGTVSPDQRQELRDRAAENNIADFYRIIYGQERGAKRDLVIVNAAAGFYVAGLATNLEQGVALAQKAIDGGAARAKLQEYAQFAGSITSLREWERRLGL